MLVSLGLCALVSCLDAANAATMVRDTSSLTVPLRRRATVSKRTTLEDFASMAENLRIKYNYSTLNRTLSRRQGSGVVPITNEQSDSSYSGQLSIGTPAQTFNVILDTGSSDLWLASTSCTQGCRGATTYNPQSSSTFSNQNQQVSIQYGSGAVQGDLSTDTVTMGGFTTTQAFLVATQVSSGLLDGTLSGLLGLGFKSIANTRQTPLVEVLSSGSSFSSPQMAFYLARQVTSIVLVVNGSLVLSVSFINDQNAQPVEQDGGTFTLGGTNSSLFTGDIDWVDIPPTVTPGFWLLAVTGITVQGSAITASNGSGSSSSSQLAAIDTGTTLIGGPSDVVAAVYAKIPGSVRGTGMLDGYYTYPCDTLVSVSFTFGGNKSWPISSADFQLRAQGSDGSIQCIGAIFELDGGSASPGSHPPRKRQSSSSTNPAWIVGDTFLKNVYSVFQYSPPAVGFAQLAPGLPGATATPGPAVGGISAGTNNEAQNLNIHAISLVWTFGLVGVVTALLRVW